MKLVQGPLNSSAKVRKDTPSFEPDSSDNEVEIRSDVTNDNDGQLDSEGCMKKVRLIYEIVYWVAFNLFILGQIVIVEEVEFDTEIKCHHVSQESCFESYTTNFKKTKVGIKLFLGETAAFSFLHF